MLLENICPGWVEAHNNLQEAISVFSESELSERPNGTGRSVREIMVSMLNHERFLISHILLGTREEILPPSEFANPALLVELGRVTRIRTEDALRPLTEAGLRAVRTLPADTNLNRYETNVTVEWLFLKILQQEIFTWGQVALRWEDMRRHSGYAR